MNCGCERHTEAGVIAEQKNCLREIGDLVDLIMKNPNMDRSTLIACLICLKQMTDDTKEMLSSTNTCPRAFTMYVKQTVSLAFKIGNGR